MLRTERPLEQGEELLIPGIAFTVESDLKIVEILFHEEAAEQTVPKGEHAAVIGVVFAHELRVMQAVHHRGRDDEPGQTIQCGRNGEVAVVEFDDRCHEERVEQQVFDTRPHQHEKGEAQQLREEDLHPVEAPARRNIEGGIAVVYGVEAPEHSCFMVETMPEVHPQVDKQDDQDRFWSGWKVQHPDTRPEAFRPLQHECHEETRREEDQEVQGG